MPYIIALIITLTVLVNGNRFFNKPKNNQQVIKRQTYTTDSLCRSTLTDKYSENDFWNENIINFNSYRYKVRDIGGGREFIPLDKAPELIITPVEKDNCLAQYNKKLQEQIKTNQIQNNNQNSSKTVQQNNSINCQIDSNYWQVLSNKAECNQARLNYWTDKLNQVNKNSVNTFNFPQDSSTNYQVPTLAPLPTYEFPTYAPHPTYDFSYLYDNLGNTNLPTLPPQPKENCQEIRNTGLYDCEANSLRPL